MSRNIVRPEAVIKFWFEETDPKFWWKKDTDFDQIIAERFEVSHHMAIQGRLSSWRESASGRLAEIIIIDQFNK